MKGHLWPAIGKVSLHDARPPIRKITECRPAAASLQRRADHPEVGLQLSTDAIDGGDDRDGDTGRDQCVFDGGGAGLISPKSANCFHTTGVGPILNARLNPIAETRVYLTNYRQ